MSNDEMYQPELGLIPHKENGISIDQRTVDGYINASAMCKASNKRFNNYVRNDNTIEFIEELARSTRIRADLLIQTITTGRNEFRGTWVHPRVAVHLAQWASPKFAVLVSEWVNDWLMAGIVPTIKEVVPDHVKRFSINHHKIPPTHFSMLNQMVYQLLGPLEEVGFIIPPKMMPDISLGIMFCNFLRKKGVDTTQLMTYDHEFIDDRQSRPANLYDNIYLTDFNIEMDDWLRNGRALKYLQNSKYFKKVATLEEKQKVLNAFNDIIDNLPQLE